MNRRKYFFRNDVITRIRMFEASGRIGSDAGWLNNFVRHWRRWRWKLQRIKDADLSFERRITNFDKETIEKVKRKLNGWSSWNYNSKFKNFMDSARRIFYFPFQFVQLNANDELESDFLRDLVVLVFVSEVFLLPDRLSMDSSFRFSCMGRR